MKPQPLSRKWLECRRQRYGELLCEGLRGDLAYRLAHAEACARRDVAKHVGPVNARQALLTWEFDGDRLGFRICGPADQLSDKQKGNILKSHGGSSRQSK